jgi:hypothetical protein
MKYYLKYGNIQVIPLLLLRSRRMVLVQIRTFKQCYGGEQTSSPTYFEHTMTEARGCTVNFRRTMRDANSFIVSSVLRQDRGLFQSRLSMRSSASTSEFQNPLISFSSSSCCLRLLPRIPVSSILSSTFPLIACFIRNFVCNT